MKVILLSHFYPRSKRDYYFSRSKTGLSAAADAHQYALALGLNKVCDNLEIVNLPAVSHFPIRYKDLRQKREEFNENGLRIVNVGYNNLIEYQHISRTVSAKKELEKIVHKTDEPIYILEYGINFAIVKAAVDLKLKYPDRIKLCMMIPDLPQDVNTHGKFASNLLGYLHGLYFRTTENSFKYFDTFVLLTDQMKEVVGCDSNYIVSEGIYEEELTRRIPHQEPLNEFVIFYGGMMYEKFGIMNLVNAFHSIENPIFRLQLCGYGDCVDRVIELSKKDDRIQYLGVLSRDEVLKFQSQASLLINPRIPDGNTFTRYSFPSKTLEYFASGTPSLIYQLEGIPKEYFNYCYSLDKYHTDIASLANKINEIANTPSVDRLTLASQARSFVIENKNSISEAKKIFDLLKKTI